MNDTLIFRPAAGNDLPRILQIIAGAQRRMREAGSRQWQNGYPAKEHIAADIRQGYGYVLQRPHATERESVIAYGAVVFDGEPAYAEIEGEWLGRDPYVVLHRLAVAEGEEGHGVGREFLLRTGQLALSRKIRSFRIDTNFDNERMLRLLNGEGFLCCGKIRYDSGERLAFEKRLCGR